MTGSTLIPCLRYRDALGAIDWLCKAFGLRRHLVHADGDMVMHAQLTFGNGMIMLGSVKPDEFGRLIHQPDEAGGSTQGTCLVVHDADAVYASAKAAGARITMDIADQGYGGRAFTCLDLEGHIWSIGSYDPWVGSSGAATGASNPSG